MQGNDLQVREHDVIVRASQTQAGPANVSWLHHDAFDALQHLLLEKSGDLNPVATPTKVGQQDALKLSQWVGLLRAPDGATVEILPKTHERPGSRQEDGSLERSRALLLRMLQATDERFRIAPPADLDTARMPLYEVVLRFVLEGIRAAIRRGIPHTYVPVYEERAGLRGRLDLPRQVRQPPHRRHLLQVVYDEFLPDRPETRLTRLTVERVLQRTRVDGTKRLARELLHALDEVPPSGNIHQDFSAWRLERGQLHFQALESLCRLVLYELNPLVAGQAAQTQALLFDMNRVYEAYVAHLLRAQHPEWQIDTQVTGRSLGEVNGVPAFQLRPDLLITLPNGEVIVADTKWKRLKPDRAPTFDVANADAYQMLAYSQVFQEGAGSKALWLIYPWLPGLPRNGPPVLIAGGRELHLITMPLDGASS